MAIYIESNFKPISKDDKKLHERMLSIVQELLIKGDRRKLNDKMVTPLFYAKKERIRALDELGEVN